MALGKYTANTNQTSLLIHEQVPDFIRDLNEGTPGAPDGGYFVTFLQKYYEFIAQANSGMSTTSDANTHYLGTEYALRALPDIGDIDNTDLDNFIESFKRQYAPTLPKKLDKDTNVRAFYKNIVDFYRAVGTEDSIKTLFRLLFNDDDIEVIFPKDRTLIASGGEWRQQVRISVNYVDNLNEIVNKKIVGANSGAYGVVEKVQVIPQKLNSYISGNIANTTYFYANNVSNSEIYDSDRIIDEFTQTAFIYMTEQFGDFQVFESVYVEGNSNYTNTVVLPLTQRILFVDNFGLQSTNSFISVDDGIPWTTQNSTNVPWGTANIAYGNTGIWHTHGVGQGELKPVGNVATAVGGRVLQIGSNNISSASANADLRHFVLSRNIGIRGEDRLYRMIVRARDLGGNSASFVADGNRFSAGIACLKHDFARISSNYEDTWEDPLWLVSHKQSIDDNFFTYVAYFRGRENAGPPDGTPYPATMYGSGGRIDLTSGTRYYNSAQKALDGHVRLPYNTAFIRPTFKVNEPADNVSYSHGITQIDFISVEEMGSMQTQYGKNIGSYESERSLLSTKSGVLQDNHYYQPFSYDIRSHQQLKDYATVVRETIHPAGYKMFGTKISESSANRGINLIPTGGISTWDSDASEYDLIREHTDGRSRLSTKPYAITAPTSVTLEISDADSYVGGKSLKVSRNSGNDFREVLFANGDTAHAEAQFYPIPSTKQKPSFVDYGIEISPGKRWVYSAYVKPTTGTSPEVTLVAYVADTNADVHASYQINSVSSHTLTPNYWNKVSLVIDLTSNENSNNSVILGAAFEIHSLNGDDYFIDALQLEEKAEGGASPVKTFHIAENNLTDTFSPDLLSSLAGWWSADTLGPDNLQERKLDPDTKANGIFGTNTNRFVIGGSTFEEGLIPTTWNSSVYQGSGKSLLTEGVHTGTEKIVSPIGDHYVLKTTDSHRTTRPYLWLDVGAKNQSDKDMPAHGYSRVIEPGKKWLISVYARTSNIVSDDSDNSFQLVPYLANTSGAHSSYYISPWTTNFTAKDTWERHSGVIDLTANSATKMAMRMDFPSRQSQHSEADPSYEPGTGGSGLKYVTGRNYHHGVDLVGKNKIPQAISVFEPGPFDIGMDGGYSLSGEWPTGDYGIGTGEDAPLAVTNTHTFTGNTYAIVGANSHTTLSLDTTGGANAWYGSTSLKWYGPATSAADSDYRAHYQILFSNTHSTLATGGAFIEAVPNQATFAKYGISIPKGKKWVYSAYIKAHHSGYDGSNFQQGLTWYATNGTTVSNNSVTSSASVDHFQLDDFKSDIVITDGMSEWVRCYVSIDFSSGQEALANSIILGMAPFRQAQNRTVWFDGIQLEEDVAEDGKPTEFELHNSANNATVYHFDGFMMEEYDPNIHGTSSPYTPSPYVLPGMSGANVISWYDQSPNKHHVYADTHGGIYNSPQYVANAINSKPAVRFMANTVKNTSNVYEWTSIGGTSSRSALEAGTATNFNPPTSGLQSKQTNYSTGRDLAGTLAAVDIPRRVSNTWTIMAVVKTNLTANALEYDATLNPTIFNSGYAGNRDSVSVDYSADVKGTMHLGYDIVGSNGTPVATLVANSGTSIINANTGSNDSVTPDTVSSFRIVGVSVNAASGAGNKNDLINFHVDGKRHANAEINNTLPDLNRSGIEPISQNNHVTSIGKWKPTFKDHFPFPIYPQANGIHGVGATGNVVFFVNAANGSWLPTSGENEWGRVESLNIVDGTDFVSPNGAIIPTRGSSGELGLPTLSTLKYIDTPYKTSVATPIKGTGTSAYLMYTNMNAVARFGTTSAGALNSSFGAHRNIIPVEWDSSNNTWYAIYTSTYAHSGDGHGTPFIPDAANGDFLVAKLEKDATSRGISSFESFILANSAAFATFSNASVLATAAADEGGAFVNQARQWVTQKTALVTKAMPTNFTWNLSAVTDWTGKSSIDGPIRFRLFQPGSSDFVNQYVIDYIVISDNATYGSGTEIYREDFTSGSTNWTISRADAIGTGDPTQEILNEQLVVTAKNSRVNHTIAEADFANIAAPETHYYIHIGVAFTDVPAKFTRWWGQFFWNDTGTWYSRYLGATGTTSVADTDYLTTFSSTSSEAQYTKIRYYPNSYSDSAGTADWDGDIAEIVVFNEKLSNTNIALVEGYLAHKYGLQENLIHKDGATNQTEFYRWEFANTQDGWAFPHTIAGGGAHGSVSYEWTAEDANNYIVLEGNHTEGTAKISTDLDVPINGDFYNEFSIRYMVSENGGISGSANLFQFGWKNDESSTIHTLANTEDYGYTSEGTWYQNTYNLSTQPQWVGKKITYLQYSFIYTTGQDNYKLDWAVISGNNHAHPYRYNPPSQIGEGNSVYSGY